MYPQLELVLELWEESDDLVRGEGGVEGLSEVGEEGGPVDQLVEQDTLGGRQGGGHPGHLSGSDGGSDEKGTYFCRTSYNTTKRLSQ